MIILIGGATHTGKTLFAQKLLEKYKYPYLSLDHLKMGLIRSGQTNLSVNDDGALTQYLWGIVKEIVKTAVENSQNLIIEGCYIPFDWQSYFNENYLPYIKYVCLIMSEKYIENNFSSIISHENAIEKRLYECDFTKAQLIEENKKNQAESERYGLKYIFIDSEYKLDLNL